MQTISVGGCFLSVNLTAIVDLLVLVSWNIGLKFRIGFGALVSVQMCLKHTCFWRWGLVMKGSAIINIWWVLFSAKYYQMIDCSFFASVANCWEHGACFSIDDPLPKSLCIRTFSVEFYLTKSSSCNSLLFNKTPLSWFLITSLIFQEWKFLVVWRSNFKSLVWEKWTRVCSKKSLSDMVGLIVLV